jgi:hypothetical protein
MTPMSDTKQNIPLYGRKWRIRVAMVSDPNMNGQLLNAYQPPGPLGALPFESSLFFTAPAIDVSNSDFDNAGPGKAALKATFKIERFGYEAINYAEIMIYNLAFSTTQDIIKEGCKVIVEAGYESNFGKIFEGEIFQHRWSRENNTDFRLMLNCLDGSKIKNDNMINFTLFKEYDQKAALKNIASQASTPFEIGVSPSIKTHKMPRGATFFGEPMEHIRDIAQDNNFQLIISDGALYASNICDPPAGEAILVTPSNGLIGTPEQTELGVTFKVLLDPRMRVNPINPVVVKLDQTQIQQIKKIQGQYYTILDAHGLYKIHKVTHTGDTRGNEWYSEVEGLSVDVNGLVPLIFGNAGEEESGN